MIDFPTAVSGLSPARTPKGIPKKIAINKAKVAISSVAGILARITETAGSA